MRDIATAVPRSAALERTRARVPAARVVTMVVLFLAMGGAVAPLVWGLSTSLKTSVEINAYPPRWIPQSLYPGNYAEALFGSNLALYMLNTTLVIVGSLALSLPIGAHAAYASARFNFPGKNALLFLLWATTMIPGVSLIVPLYLLAIEFGLYDTYSVLILVKSAWLVPTLIWLLRGFIQAIPVEIEEAAIVDGCTRLAALYRVIFPLMGPGLVASAILVFVRVWSEFLIAYSLTLSDSKRLVQVGLYFFITEVGIEWGPLMAATIVSLIPVVVVFVLLQRHFIQGLTAGAVKG